MSSLWTPGGERPVRPEPQAAAPPPRPPGDDVGDDGDEPDAETRARVDELRRQLLATPVEVVVANHAYGLFELAAIHLSAQPPALESARVAVDGLGALVEGLTGRLGDAEAALRDALAQIRLAFVQIAGAQSSGNGDSGPSDHATGEPTAG